MAVERKIGQWSCQVSAGDTPLFIQVSDHAIVVTNVSLAPDLRGDGRSSLVLHHVSTHPHAEDEKTQEAAVACLTPGKIECASINLSLNVGQQVAFEVRGDNDIHLIGHYTSTRASASSASLEPVSAQSASLNPLALFSAYISCLQVHSQARLSQGKTRPFVVPRPRRSPVATGSNHKIEDDEYTDEDRSGKRRRKY
ncbi:hypothetical protein DFH06DRAFT_1328439 [Mycena polygramma]|nr:hypothetical protein DFH06DRAFT_1341095 [Mycena polygramma]KAJ7656880.1 hypothetical protein DFH06DRAFT_1328423 [Mycena polygramma]KAJ7656897.1 hypothetical protein DFH06DRAFT_1328439 [Mycena polygramma]